MEGLETIWDIDNDGGQSIVQKFRGTCVKLYPECIVNNDILKLYHTYQWSLEDFSFEIEQPYLRALWYKKINLKFVDLSEVEIWKGCDIETRVRILITQMPFIDGEQLVGEGFYDSIFSDVINYFREHYNTRLRFLAVSLYRHNIKLISSDNGILELVCTDVFWDISWMVTWLLSRNKKQ